jgi:hypothetical protein
MDAEADQATYGFICEVSIFFLGIFRKGCAGHIGLQGTSR